MARTGPLLLLVATVALALGFVLLRRGPSPAIGPSAAPASPVQPQAQLENPAATRVETPAGPRPKAGYPAELDDPTRFDGSAKVEVHLSVAAGVPLPERWVLSFEPSLTRIGGDRARARSVEVRGQTVVRLNDVALGSYSVRALAEGLECAPYEVELRKPDELDVVFSLELHARGFLAGRVVDGTGQPVAGLPVFAVAQRGGAARQVATEPDGTYRFEGLPDGDYRVRVGNLDVPLAAAEDVSFAAPSLHLRDLVTPPLGAVRVRVLDAAGAGVPGVRVSGVGLPSGPFELVTGPEGRGSARPCAGGELALYAEDPRAGRGDVKLRFDPGAELEIELRVRP